MPPPLNVIQQFDEAETKAIDTCTTCPKLCRWACPVADAEARETTSPWNLMIASGFLKRGLATVDELSDIPYHCTHCGACTEACLHKNDVPLVLSLTRARQLAGHVAPERVVEVCGHFGTAGNAYGTRLEGELDEIVQRARGDAGSGGSGALLYMPGCATIHEAPEAAGDFLQALAVNGVTGVAVNDASASCCGLPLLWAGDLNGFRSHANRHATRLANADTVIVHDPACAHAMKVRYPQFGVTLSPEVLHVSSFLASRLTKEARTPYEHSVAYADCCSLARGLSLVDEPRLALARALGRPPIELVNISGHDLDCCGAAGLLPSTAPSTATAMGEARLYAFKQTGASKLATFSPRCAAHLRSIDPTVDIIDGSTLLAKV